MHCSKAALTALLAGAIVYAAAPKSPAFRGQAAYDFTRAVVAFGPRPVGSHAHAATETYIESQIKLTKAELLSDSFTAQTPDGTLQMKNIMARFRGATGNAIVVSGHYDTKKLAKFQGANDGGSSTGFLLEMLHAVAKQKYSDDIYLVWLDGEEAVRDWTDTDSVYGSRHLEEKWARDGTLSHIKALINVNMIGDKDLGILLDENSSKPLRTLVWDTARDLGYSKYFLDIPQPIEDDHIPFVHAGINALDLIDFDYGPQNSYWHTPQDTMDKLSARSFQVLGNVLIAVLNKLEG